MFKLLLACMVLTGELLDQNLIRNIFSQTKVGPALGRWRRLQYYLLPHERRGGEGSGHHRQTFNSLINHVELMDLPIYDQSFTWTNVQERPILAKLDRVLVSSEWESHFPLASLHTLPWSTSDHAPLCQMLEIRR